MKELVAKEKRVRGYPLNIRNAFDLFLYRFTKTSNYQLVVFMKIQFFFYNDDPNTWSESECRLFAKQWEFHIKETWGNKVLMELDSGEKVYINFKFDIQLGGWMFDHWEINVIKVDRDSFRVSYVKPNLGRVYLDSEDFKYITGQRGALHEFGHMIGLDDEYKGHYHINDFKSIMHSAGELIRDRHVAQFKHWVLQKVENLAELSLNKNI